MEIIACDIRLSQVEGKINKPTENKRKNIFFWAFKHFLDDKKPYMDTQTIEIIKAAAEYSILSSSIL